MVIGSPVATTLPFFCRAKRMLPTISASGWPPEGPYRLMLDNVTSASKGSPTKMFWSGSMDCRSYLSDKKQSDTYTMSLVTCMLQYTSLP